MIVTKKISLFVSFLCTLCLPISISAIKISNSSGNIDAPFESGAGRAYNIDILFFKKSACAEAFLKKMEWKRNLERKLAGGGLIRFMITSLGNAVTSGGYLLDLQTKPFEQAWAIFGLKKFVDVPPSDFLIDDKRRGEQEAIMLATKNNPEEQSRRMKEWASQDKSKWQTYATQSAQGTKTWEVADIKKILGNDTKTVYLLLFNHKTNYQQLLGNGEFLIGSNIRFEGPYQIWETPDFNTVTKDEARAHFNSQIQTLANTKKDRENQLQTSTDETQKRILQEAMDGCDKQTEIIKQLMKTLNLT